MIKTLDEAYNFASEHGLVVSRHKLPDSDIPRFTMWINTNDPNSARVVVPVSEEAEFITRVEALNQQHQKILDDRVGKNRYSVETRSVYTEHIIVAAEDEKQACIEAERILKENGPAYNIFSHCVDTEVWKIEKTDWEE